MPEQQYDVTDRESILKFGKRLEGSCLAALVLPEKIERLTALDKGEYGKLVEGAYFSIFPGQSRDPDFPVAKLELKVSPLERGIRSFNIKERMKLSMLNYDKIKLERWGDCSLLRKNGVLLIVFYWFEEKVDPFTFSIDHVNIWEFPEEDLELIRQDWEKIVSKIRSGQGGSLSQSDTLILEAATAGAGRQRVLRKDDSGKAMKVRSLSLKKSYVKFVYDRLKGNSGQGELQSLLQKWEARRVSHTKQNFEEQVVTKADQYRGRSFHEICQSLGVDPQGGGKGKYAALAQKMLLGPDGKKVAEFVKSGLELKTIRLKNGTPAESMSFPYFKYRELVHESWETSTLRELLTRRFLFVIFREDKGDLIFEGLRFWNMSEDLLDAEVKRIWQETVDRVNAGRYDGLPGLREGRVVHVRPHGTKGDMIEGLGSIKYRKQSFWLSAPYLRDELADQSQLKFHDLPNKRAS